MNKEKIILGIDPGTNLMGYGFIRIVKQRIILQQNGVIKLSAYKEHSLKLKKIFETSLRLIEQYLPDELAIEAPFYGKNVQSMLKLGRAQGVAIAAALYREIPVFEYSPRKIKMAVAGTGKASKEQVAGMIETLTAEKIDLSSFDVTDAIAVAICHHFQGDTKIKNDGYNSWSAFVKKNPDKIF